MTDAVRFPLVLGLISVCSAGALAVSYVVTRDEIRRQERLQKDRGLAEVFGVELKEDDPKRPWSEVPPPSGQASNNAYAVYAATEPKSSRALYSAEGSARGYSSRISVVVAVDQAIRDKPDAARIRGVKVVSQAETPGLGDKCQAPDFQRQFADLLVGRLDLKKGAPYRQPGSSGGDDQPVAAITGATITSNAVLNAVRQALDRIRQRTAQPPQPGGAAATP